MLSDYSTKLRHMSSYWTHPSVRGLGGDRDPVEAIVERAREVVLDALEKGWTGPPFDPFALAKHLNIPVVPRDDINDARTIPLAGNRLQVEYNPHKPQVRVRFSVAHELAHTLFPDCRDQTRHRLGRDHMKADDWQLEMLCNLAAAEMLMPVGSFEELRDEELSIDRVLSLRERYQVSAEAVLYRIVRLSQNPVAAFCCSRLEDGADKGRYRVDVIRGHHGLTPPLAIGDLLPADSVAAECTAIGFTAKSDEHWGKNSLKFQVECVGAPPYPDHTFPRVLGLLIPKGKQAGKPSKISYLKGDATQPRGTGQRIIAHVVNDKAARWGAGFAKAVKAKWPTVQTEFIEWSQRYKSQFKLGNCRLISVEPSLGLFQMIAQRGYGDSAGPRIRYTALSRCLDELGQLAASKSASVHMPRIGCGQAGGHWFVVRELVEESLVDRGISVFVYDLPDEDWNEPRGQQSLFS
ncbi:MAG: ImmA/IrrE family metallo-endopeptidase [Pirellulales bacterium]